MIQLKILIAEDIRVERNDLRILLTDNGYTNVIAVATFQEALDVIETNDVAIALLD